MKRLIQVVVVAGTQEIARHVGASHGLDPQEYRIVLNESDLKMLDPARCVVLLDISTRNRALDVPLSLWKNTLGTVVIAV
jgi:hypothetical protein